MIAKQIMEECRKYGYKLDRMSGSQERCDMWFRNKSVRDELQMFEVVIDKDIERVAMAIIMDLGSWNEATEYDYNDIEDIKEGISSWLSEENLKEVEKWFLED